MVDFDDIQIWGCNIPNEVKVVLDSVSDKVKASFENDDQRMAYQIGVDNALSALKHLLQEGLRKNNITIYYSNTDTSTELDAESVVKWAESLPDLI